VPSGFIEAYAQSGRNIGQGIQQIGNAIGESLQRYGQNKQENEFLQTRLESLAPYLNTVAQSGNIMDKNSPESKLLGDIEKFSSMSLPQKKATLLNAEFFLDRADKAKAREMQDIQTAAAQLQLEDAVNKRKQQGILTEAIRYGLEQPTTTTQMQQVTDTIEFPPMPGVSTPAVQATPSQAEATAARYFMGRYGQAAQDLARYGTDLGRQANTLNVSQIPRFTGPISLGQEDPEAYLSQQFESPIQAAARAESNTRLKQQQLAESQAAIQQAGIMSRSPALQTIAPRMLQPEQQAQPIQQPSQTITRNVSTQVPISYEDQSKRLTQYLIQQGATPETISMVPQILERVGQRRPTTIEQVGNLGSVIRFGDKEQFVPNPKTDIGDILKVRGLTINSPEFRGQAPTEAEAKEFREQYSNVLDSRRSISRLIEIAQLGKAQQQTPEIKAEAEQLAIGAQGALRLEILGPGTVTEPDREILKTIVPNPTRIFSLQSSNIKALKSLLERAGNGIETKAKALGLEVLNPKQQSTVPASGGIRRWNTVTQKFE
jgi:hypothetical protein